MRCGDYRVRFLPTASYRRTTAHVSLGPLCGRQTGSPGEAGIDPKETLECQTGMAAVLPVADTRIIAVVTGSRPRLAVNSRRVGAPGPPEEVPLGWQTETKETIPDEESTTVDRIFQTPLRRSSVCSRA